MKTTPTPTVHGSFLRVFSTLLTLIATCLLANAGADPTINPLPGLPDANGNPLGTPRFSINGSGFEPDPDNMCVVVRNGPPGSSQTLPLNVIGTSPSGGLSTAFPKQNQDAGTELPSASLNESHSAGWRSLLAGSSHVQN